MATEATQWFDGEGLPTNDIGLSGDYFLNVSNADIYKKIGTSWQRIGNIKGTQGLQGEKGERGEKGLKGDRGAAGAQGPAGPQGSPGKAGAIWYDGIGEPETTLGVVNDFYLNIFNGDIYKKKGLAYWERISSFLPDLTYFSNKIDEIYNLGVDKVQEIDTTFTANMQNMANTFNTNMSNYNNTFNTMISSQRETYNTDKNTRDNTFTNNMQSMSNEFDSFLATEEQKYKNKFDAIASVAPQSEIINARESVDGTVHDSLSARLIYDFNDVKNNLVVKGSELTNDLNWMSQGAFGLGGNAITTTNLNNLTQSGFYQVNNNSSAPTATGMYNIININYNSTNQTQMAFQITNTVTLFTRVKVNGTWTSWNSGGLTSSQLAAINKIPNLENQVVANYDQIMTLINDISSKLD